MRTEFIFQNFLFSIVSSELHNQIFPIGLYPSPFLSSCHITVHFTRMMHTSTPKMHSLHNAWYQNETSCISEWFLSVRINPRESHILRATPYVPLVLTVTFHTPSASEWLSIQLRLCSDSLSIRLRTETETSWSRKETSRTLRSQNNILYNPLSRKNSQELNFTNSLVYKQNIMYPWAAE